MLCNKHSRNCLKNIFNLSPQQHMAIHMELIIREAVFFPFGQRNITVNQNVFNQLMDELWCIRMTQKKVTNTTASSYFFFAIVDFSYLVSSFSPHHLSFRGCGESRAVPQPGRKTEQPFPISPCSVLTQTLRFSHNFQLIKCLYVWHSNH